MTDPDDVEYLTTLQAVEELFRAAHRLADPRMAIIEFAEMVVLVGTSRAAADLSTLMIVRLCARRVHHDVVTMC